MQNRVRTALITGAAKGIGRAIADKLADNNFRIIAVYKSSEDAAYRLAAELNERGIFCMAVKCDTASSLEVEALYRRSVSVFGFVDTLINCAGVSLSKLIQDYRDADYNAVLDNNLRSAFNCCRAFSKDMIANGFGRIVNISSVFGRVGGAGEAVYSASKAAVTGLTRALSKELGPSNITVNAVSPGFIETDMTKNVDAAGRAEFLSKLSLPRLGTPADVADAVELLTRERLYITGADIAVDGGYI